MPALQLRLPEMVMGVDEAGAENLMGAINDFGIG